MLGHCEVCPSWPTEKAHKCGTKAESSEKHKAKLTTTLLKTQNIKPT